jgi:hypothetical protein
MSAALHGATPEQLIRRWYARLWNQWDTSVFPEVLATDITFRGSLGKLVVGQAGSESPCVEDTQPGRRPRQPRRPSCIARLGWDAGSQGRLGR